MATKTVYIPRLNDIGVDCKVVTYKYYGGFALSQKQKCIESLHESNKKYNI